MTGAELSSVRSESLNKHCQVMLNRFFDEFTEVHDHLISRYVGQNVSLPAKLIHSPIYFSHGPAEIMYI